MSDMRVESRVPAATRETPPRGKEFPPVRWLPETPVRERGVPERPGPPVKLREERIWAVAREKVRGSGVSSLAGAERPGRVRGAVHNSATREPREDEDDFEQFWGQLWFVPKSKPVKARVREKLKANLVWVRKDLWSSKSFDPEDCFPIGAGDSWVGTPAKLQFTDIFWGDDKRKSFKEVVMAGRGRGRGPRPRSLDGEWDRWGGGEGWNQYPPFHPQPSPGYFNQAPPPPFGFYPNPPPLPFQQQFPPPPPYRADGPRPRGGGTQGRGRGRQQQQPMRVSSVQSQAGQTKATEPGSGLPQQKIGGEKVSECEKEVDGDVGETSKCLQAVCFNCGEMGHLSSTCSSPRVCFICQSVAHTVDHCPEWKKPPVAAQYYGSANRGLGFYHIDVEARGRRFKHWKGLENLGILKIEEGAIVDEEIVKNLKELFDPNWSWLLKKIGEGKYIIRFPPDRKVESIVIGKTTLFYLNQGSVVASLSNWNGEFEPLGSLAEVWVQISGVPPKWVDWDTLREVTSSIGLMMEIDWHSLFNSFFNLARVKVQCKDPSKIPKARIFVFKGQMYKIFFTPEGVEQVENGHVEGSEKGDDDDLNSEEEDLLDDEAFGKEGGLDAASTEKEGSEGRNNQSELSAIGKQNALGSDKGGTSVKRALLFECMSLEEQEQGDKCGDWVRAMELEVDEEEEIEEDNTEEELEKSAVIDCQEEELVNLPEEWAYDLQQQKQDSSMMVDITSQVLEQNEGGVEQGAGDC